jgi:hypothetical protein
MIAWLGNRLRPARRARPTTDTRRQTHSGVGGVEAARQLFRRGLGRSGSDQGLAWIQGALVAPQGHDR